jgi:DNA (cytosine-5)-methyltransferase 1
MLGEGLRAGVAYLGGKTRTVCYVEREAYAASVLAKHCQAGTLDDAPIWSDVCTFDATAWRGKVDCVVAGFPCQDLSVAGRRAGLDGKRSGLFFEVLRIAADCGARFLFLENVAGIHSAAASVMDEASASDYAPKSSGDGFSGVGIEDGRLLERAASRVMGELADLGWDSEWVTISASDVGANHRRARWFCWAWRADSIGAQRSGQAQFGAEAGREELGNTGLQPQHLQQREEGAEHQGAGQPVDHPERAERGAELANTSQPGPQGSQLSRACTCNGGGRKHMDQLANFVAYSPQAQVILDGQTSLQPSLGEHQPSPKRLNPYFVENLMGWPAGWTSATAQVVCGPVAMESWQRRLQSLLLILCGG